MTTKARVRAPGCRAHLHRRAAFADHEGVFGAEFSHKRADGGDAPREDPRARARVVNIHTYIYISINFMDRVMVRIRLRGKVMIWPQARGRRRCTQGKILRRGLWLWLR